MVTVYNVRTCRVYDELVLYDDVYFNMNDYDA